MDALAARGARFTGNYTSDAPCLPSRTALYTGRFGIHTGVVGHGGTAADPFHDGARREFRDEIEQTSLPRVLQTLGFHTAQISPFGQRHAARQFYAGFNEIHNTGQGGMESAEVVTPVVSNWLRANATRDNWFLHLNYWDPHTPYRVPADRPNWFANDPLPAWLTPEVLQQHQDHPGPHGALQISMYNDATNPAYPRHPGALRTMADLRQMIDGYDMAVRYVDQQLELIIDQLRTAGVLEETAIIISADHGENLGELAIYGEHATADHITCRVPLIVVWPGLKPGGAARLLDWHQDAMTGSQQAVDPLWTVMREGGPFHAQRRALVEYLPFLERTGRGHHVAELKRRHGSGG